MPTAPRRQPTAERNSDQPATPLCRRLPRPPLFLLNLVLLAILCTGPARAEEETFRNSVDPDFLRQLQLSSEYRVAVLPMENFTVEGDIDYHFRNRLSERLRAKGYSVVDSRLVDEKLFQLGISHAGQLGLLSFEQLQGLTSADAFLSGVVEQGTVQHAGVFNSYVYTCSVKLQDRNGRVIWSALQNRVAKRRVAIDPVNMFLDMAMVKGGGEMEKAVYALADRMLAQLPDGPVQVLATGDSLLDMAVETTAREGSKQ